MTSVVPKIIVYTRYIGVRGNRGAEGVVQDLRADRLIRTRNGSSTLG